MVWRQEELFGDDRSFTQRSLAERRVLVAEYMSGVSNPDGDSLVVWLRQVKGIRHGAWKRKDKYGVSSEGE